MENLASEWIEAQRDKTDEQRLYNPPAIEAVINLSISDPEALWLLILEVLSRDDVDDVLYILGAGPLEDLIAIHGEDFIERIRIELKGNSKLVSALEYVWVSEDVKPSVEAYVELGCQFVSAKVT